MKRLNDEQKKFFYLGLTLFISLSLVALLLSLFTRIGFLLALVRRVFGALSSVWIGLIIAYLISPVVRFFENKVFLKLFKGKKGLARGVSVSISIILMLAIIVGLMVLVIPQLIDTIATLTKNMPFYYKSIQTWIRDFATDHPSIGPNILEFMDSAYGKLIHWLQNDLLPSANILGTLTSGIMSAAGIVLDFFVGLIISIYLLCDKENFLAQTRKLLAAIFNEKWYTRIMTVCSETHHVFGEFITGKIIDSLFVGIMTFIFMWIVGIPYATLVSVLVAVMNLIPFFGQFIAIIPSTLLILVISPVKALIFLVGIIVFMQIDGNVISPKILGDSIGLKSFWILFAIISFGGMFGIVGMLIGVPVFAMIYRIITRFMDRHLRKKGLPTEAYVYTASSPTYPDRKTRRKLRKNAKNENTDDL